MNPWNGSMRRRLTVESGLSVEYFVVNKLDAKAATINETVSSRRA